ncbi:MAG: transketolase, partial [Spirochaetaceae bacterium]|nr:transketolase [Spirochaetaceae bacterium]
RIQVVEERGTAKEREKLADLARQIRRDVVRMVRGALSGHPGGALGIAEIMAALYAREMTHRPASGRGEDRDRLVLSNGHICAAQYSALARVGLIESAELSRFRRLGSRLQGHPSHVFMPEFVDASVGPLGQGFSVANGLALGLRLSGGTGRVYCIVGDGEMQEGQVWEALMTAAKFRLSNLLLFISYNGIQIDGAVDDVKRIEPLSDRLAAFGWKAMDIDGHDIGAILGAFASAREETSKPTAIVARTVMGKGVPFMEGLAKWHGTCPTADEAAAALEAIGSAAGYQDFPFEGGRP